MQARTRIALLIILVAALAARLAFSMGVVGWSAPMKSDETDYHAIASNLAAGDGFALEGGAVTARRPPAYPFLLSLLYRVTGPSPDVGRVLQVILGVVIVAMVYLLGRRIADETIGLVAAGLAAVNPFLVFISGYVLTENLYVVVLLAFLLVAPTPRALLSTSLRRVAVAAILLGVAALVRPTALVFAGLVVLAALLWGGGSWQARARRLLIVSGIFAAVVLPWMLRNAVVFGGWVGLTTHGGITFFQGNNPKILSVPHYRGGVTPLAQLPRYDQLAQMNERDRDRLAWQMGREYLRYNWRDAPRLVGWKFLRLWRLRSDAGLSGIRSGWWFDRKSRLGDLAAKLDVGFLYALVVLPLFVAGLVISRRRYRELAFLYAVIVAHTAIALVFFGSLRSRIPIEPIIGIFATLTLSVVFLRRRRRKAPAPAET